MNGKTDMFDTVITKKYAKKYKFGNVQDRKRAIHTKSMPMHDNTKIRRFTTHNYNMVSSKEGNLIDENEDNHTLINDKSNIDCQ